MQARPASVCVYTCRGGAGVVDDHGVAAGGGAVAVLHDHWVAGAGVGEDPLEALAHRLGPEGIGHKPLVADFGKERRGGARNLKKKNVSTIKTQRRR